jgi:hypothetical protein
MANHHFFLDKRSPVFFEEKQAGDRESVVKKGFSFLL